jgi:hypothetical protein
MTLKKSWALFLIFGVFHNLFLYSKQHYFSCAQSYKFPDGKKYGAAHHDINRSGVILIVPTGIASSDALERYGIVVGHDKNLECWMIGQAGKSEACDCSTAITASRELLEETGGFVEMSAEEIAKLPYMCIAQKQIFIYKTDDQWLALKIKKSVKAVQDDRKMGRSYKEINDIELVTLKNLLDLAKKIDQGLIKQSKYFVCAVSGKKIKLNNFYTQLFAYPSEHDRFEFGKKMLEAVVQ